MLRAETLDRLKESRRAEGRCPECGRPKLRHSEYCERHRLTRDINAYSRARYRKAKARGLCPTCEGVTGGGFVRCEFCRRNARLYAQKRENIQPQGGTISARAAEKR